MLQLLLLEIQRSTAEAEADIGERVRKTDDRPNEAQRRQTHIPSR